MTSPSEPRGLGVGADTIRRLAIGVSAYSLESWTSEGTSGFQGVCRR